MDLENRLAMAQLLNDLLKQKLLIKFGNKKVDDKLKQELLEYVKKHIYNLLMCVMGEQTDASFTEEEVSILKKMVARIKNNDSGVKQ